MFTLLVRLEEIGSIEILEISSLRTSRSSLAWLTRNFWGTGASFVDIDNDGDLDLYACQYMGENRLYLNRGDGVFDAG